MGLFNNNPDFYPTPNEVIEKMMMGEDFYNKIILEPSAGSGNIVKWLQNNGAKEVIACEKDENLRKLLNGVCELISDDFLKVTAEQVSHVQMIVMNPPFSADEKHILHAYEIAPPGCTIIALCNTNTISNDGWYKRVTTDQQKLTELIADYGRTECLGECFDTAERKTNVKVSLIKLYKEAEGESEFDSYFFSQVDEDACSGKEGLMSYNFVREIVNRYVSAVKLFDDTLAAANKINEIATYTEYYNDENGKEQKRTFGNLPISFNAVRYNERNGQREAQPVTHARYKKDMKKYYWHIIFQKMNMEKYATKELREQINKFIETQETVPFTMHNVYRLIEMVVATNGNRMENALEEVFDKVCSLSAQNNTAGEKWKTNANYMVNKRFIVDYLTECDERWSKEPYVKVRYGYGNSNIEFINDLIKALCWLTGKDYNEIGELRAFCCDHKQEWGKWFEWGFFKVRCYKKGTSHFEFLDENVWALFNQRVAEIKAKKDGRWTVGSKEEKKPKPKKQPEQPQPEKKENQVEGGTSADTPSPILNQYMDLKNKHPEALLLFRCGDFYETYCQDAEDAAKILGITLTKSVRTKEKDGRGLRMAGFPYHALDTYLPRLIRAGKRVAISDAIEPPKPSEVSKHGVTELIKPAEQPKVEPEQPTMTQLELF